MGTTECELYRTVRIMSQVTKIHVLLGTIMMQVRNKIKSEIVKEQCSFLEGKGTVFILRTIIL